MNNALVKIELPAAFITSRVLLTPRELVFGYEHGWLTAKDVIEVALAAFEAGHKLPPAEEELALLLSDELGRLPDLVGQLAQSSAVAEESDWKAVWLFLALDWLHEHRSDYLEPLKVIELLYAEFDYPQEIEDLVGFMPAPAGVALGHRTLEQRWAEFLRSKSADYRRRR